MKLLRFSSRRFYPKNDYHLPGRRSGRRDSPRRLQVIAREGDPVDATLPRRPGDRR